jgi:hypothetical protein
MLLIHTPQQVEQNRKFYLNMYDSSHQLVQIDQTMNWYQLYENLKVYYPKPFGRPSVAYRNSQNPNGSIIGRIPFRPFHL